MKYYSFLIIAALICIGSCDDDDDDNGDMENTVRLNLVADGINSPVFLTESPDNSGRLFVVDQSGQISKASSNGLGNVSVGGYVYSSGEITELSNKYIFGVLSQDPDGMNGAIFAATRSGGMWNYHKLSISNMDSKEIDAFVIGFGQNKSGDVYVLTSGGAAASGKVHKIGAP